MEYEIKKIMRYLISERIDESAIKINLYNTTELYGEVKIYDKENFVLMFKNPIKYGGTLDDCGYTRGCFHLYKKSKHNNSYICLLSISSANETNTRVRNILINVEKMKELFRFITVNKNFYMIKDYTISGEFTSIENIDIKEGSLLFDDYNLAKEELIRLLEIEIIKKNDREDYLIRLMNSMRTELTKIGVDKEQKLLKLKDLKN